MREDILVIDSHNQIFLNCENIQLTTLRAKLVDDNNAFFIIAADSFADVNVFTQVLDTAREFRDPTRIKLKTFPDKGVDHTSCPQLDFQTSQIRMSDQEYERELLGVWSISYEEEGYSLYSETKYNDDGRAVGKGESCTNNVCELIEFTLSWSVKDGVLIAYEISSNDGTPPGTIYKERIDSLTYATLITYGVESGDKQVRKRIMRPKLLSR